MLTFRSKKKILQQKTVLNLDSMDIKPNDNWSNASGCYLKHPFDKDKRAECERLAAQSAKNVGAQADLLLAQAALEKSKQPSSSWTATQTLMVIGGSLLAITLMVVVIKKIKSKNQ